jgi:predicted metal-dependent peptidase
MANRKQLSPEEERRDRNRRMIHGARWILERTALNMLLQDEKVRLVECGREASDPDTGSVDPSTGVLSLNVFRRSLSQEQWAAVIGHLLLRLGLNQAAQRGDRDPLVWNYACYESVEKMLPMLGLPSFQNEGLDFAESGEEAIYDFLREAQHAGKPIQSLRTLAGLGRPDIVGVGRFHAWNSTYETLLAQGIRLSVESAIEAAAATLDAELKTAWMPAERAKRWVMSEMPLLGALASHITVIARADLCERMDISVAAVNGDLMEMYFNPLWKLTQGEVRFIYVHELLHVALMHHSRAQGRDPLMWNFACDFVINGWLVEMGVGTLPSIGVLYDPRLQGMSAEAVYDLLAQDPKRCKNLRGFRGKLGDVLITPRGQIYKDEVTTLDDLIRRCMATGMACTHGRGTMPAGLLEEIRSLFTPPVPWDVELARWMDAHIPALRDPLRTYARASRRQSSTPDIPRPARYIPQEWKEAHTFGVVLDTSGSMDRELLGRALGAIASYAEARDVAAIRLVLCDAAPYDRGVVAPSELRGVFSVQGRGGTVLQPAINFLLSRSDFPPAAPIMIITDGWCEEELTVPREHCFLLPRKSETQRGMPLRTTASVFRVLKEERYE